MNVSISKKVYVGLAVILVIIVLTYLIILQQQKQKGSPLTSTPPLPTSSPYDYPTPTLSSTKYNPDTQTEGAAEQERKFLRKEHPDIFLYSRTPYENPDFSVTSHFKNEPTGHFTFTVVLKTTNKEEAKTKFIEWVKSFGISEEQIPTLDITYQ